MMGQKKSIFYTAAAVALSIVIIVTYSAYTTYRLSAKMDVTQTRIETVNFFIKDIERDLGKGIYIAGFRTLLSFNQYITTNGTFIDSVGGRFRESFVNGTINGQPLSLMKDSTFADWANKISAEADKIDIRFDYTITDVRLNQTDPWTIDLGVNVSLNIRDKRNTSYWMRERYLTSRIGITGFEDPLYAINSKGRIANTIIKSNITDFVVGGNTKNLMIHTNNSYYSAHNDSPNFLMRLEGNLGNSTFGIESLVNLDKFLQQGISIKDRSAVDYIYFGTQSTVNYRINSTPEWFKIDEAHLDFYQLRNITI